MRAGFLPTASPCEEAGCLRYRRPEPDAMRIVLPGHPQLATGIMQQAKTVAENRESVGGKALQIQKPR